MGGFPFSTPQSMLRHNHKVLSGEYECGVDFDAPPSVLDLGGNCGAFAVWSRARWQGASVIAYEPNPSAAIIFAINTEGMDVELHQKAVRGEAGTAFLHFGANNLGEASLHKGDEQVEDGVIVDCVAARDLPDCDVLKIDTEGCEVEILRGYFTGRRPDTKAVLFEFHSADDRVEIDALLCGVFEGGAGLGFTLVRGTIHSADRGTLCYVRRQ